jgi:hypothetical protein
VLDSQSVQLVCQHCQKKYSFGEDILRQIKKFESLCHEIQNAEEILGNTSVAIDVGSHHVKVPFRLLLTRLGSVLDLVIGSNKMEIFFRTEPLRDLDEILKSKTGN